MKTTLTKSLSVIIAIMMLCIPVLCGLTGFADDSDEYGVKVRGIDNEDGKDAVAYYNSATKKLTVKGTGEIIGLNADTITGAELELDKNVKSLEILPGITRIGENAFRQYENLSEVILHEGLESIGEYAFLSTDKLKEIAIPASVTDIGRHAFAFCFGMEQFIVNDNNPNYSSSDGTLYTKNMEELIQYPIGNPRSSYSVPEGVIKLGVASFRRAEKLKELTLPDSLKIIDHFTFYDCYYLRTVRMPKTLEFLGELSFAGCERLESIVVPDGLETILSCTFSLCLRLREVHIPHSVTFIEYDAFYGCDNLRDIYYDGTAAEWGALSIQGQSINFYFAKMHFNDEENTGASSYVFSTVRNLLNMLRRMFIAFLEDLNIILT